MTGDKVDVAVSVEEIPFEKPTDFYERETNGGQQLGMLLESRRHDLTYGTKAVAITNPGIQLTGKGDRFELRALNRAGMNALDTIAGRFSAEGVEINCLEDRIQGKITRSRLHLPEHLRIRQPGLGSVIRELLSIFNVNDPDAGLYGAFAYDYVRQGEKIGNRFSSQGGPDVNLLLPLEVVVFDEIKERAVRKTYGFGKGDVSPELSVLSFGNYVGKSEVDLTDSEYMERVEKIIREIAAGEMIQAVLSRADKVGLAEHPFESYKRLAGTNPSPYCFFYNMGGDEALFGASPEMHIRVNDRYVEIRPLAGTLRRNRNDSGVDEFYDKQGFLDDKKESSEHVMLVDLARNDLSRFAKGVTVVRFKDIVEFPNLYHIGSSIRGRLREGFDSIDAILSTLPQGTLSGAPKVRAMQEIEELEGSRRGYYGGCVGVIGFNGDCNTAITIRSVYTSGGYGFARSGAGVVLRSTPEGELNEIKLKNGNQMRALKGGM